MDKAKCINENCGKILGSEDRIWQIRVIYGDGLTTYAACCSEDCAQQVQEKYATLHEQLAADMRHQCFQIMRLKNFPVFR